MAALAAGLPLAAWQEVTVAEGAQGPRTYRFVARRVWERRDGLPGRACRLPRRNLDGSEARSYLSNAPLDTPLLTLAQVAAARWIIETEFETAKGETGLDEYEVRSWQEWHHHITLALLAGVFLLTLQQDWGGKMPQITRPQLSRVPRALLPQRVWTTQDLLAWLHTIQAHNERAKDSHLKRRYHTRHNHETAAWAA